MTTAWTSDQLVIFDVTDPQEPTRLLGHATRIDYGDEGSIHAVCPLPLGRGLYEAHGEGAVIELVLHLCGCPDDYRRMLPVVRICADACQRWTDLPESWPIDGVSTIDMNVLWGGKVELLDVDQRERT